MATKLYNSHLSKILFECNEYYILDTYIALVHISSEVNNKYLIQTYSDSKSDIISLARKHVKASYKTVYNCIDKLINLNILEYNYTLCSWTLVNMEYMTASKSFENIAPHEIVNSNEDINSYENIKSNKAISSGKNIKFDNNINFSEITEPSQNQNFTGYTHIRSFFFTEEFSKMKAREKRLMIYMSQLSDSKLSAFHPEFSMNLLKPKSSWLMVLRTTSKYYAKYTIEKMLSTYSNLFVNKTEEFRAKDLSPKKNKNFKFIFKCVTIKEKSTEDTNIDLIKLNNPNEYILIKEKLSFCEVTLSKQKIMHLIRAISNLKEWSIKERVVQLIVNKYRAIQVHKSRDDIKSLPAYAAAVVLSVVSEFKKFKDGFTLNNISKYELEEHFIAHTSNDESNNLKSNNLTLKIENSLSLIQAY
ncbi:MAG: hypothetical protein ACRC68_18730 [Clostridium sp.]